MGRPSDYSRQIADIICEKLADGQSLRAICSDVDMPNRATVFRWLADHVEFSDQYARAREAQAEALVEESFEIADDASNDWMEKHFKEQTAWVVNGEAVQRSRLRIEHRRWAAEKLKPKVYGNRQFVEHSGHIALLDVSDADLIGEITELLATGRLKLPNGVQLEEREDDDLEDDDPYGVG